jgi:putative membrane-bound dehydrogenase-like protein
MKYPLALLPLLFIALRTLAAPVSLFDGRTLEGWDYDPQMWRVEDGVMTGGSTTEKIKANYFIATKKSYANFDLRLKIKCSGDPKTGLINSGIQIRSVRVPGGAHMSGYQIDCGAGWFGKIYDEFRRNKVIANPVDAAALDKAVDVFGWNEYRIRAEGPRIQTWINGVLAIDFTETDPNIALDGQIAPQVHSGGVALVQVKDVTIEELPPTPGAPTWELLGGVEAARKLVAPAPKPQAAAEAKPMKEGNAPTSGAKTPEEERATFQLPEGFEAELVAAEDPGNGIGKFVPIAFDQKGALWTTTALEYPVDGNENPAAADALYASKAKDKVLVYDRDPKSPTGYSPKARVFAEGLAIPLGVLPYKNGCYVQHGHDIAFLEDTDADGKADKRTVILSGFGVQDSHLFPHQFLRAPGGWIWMAQGLFNRSAVKTSDGKTVEFDMCRMAKFRPDGTQFEPTSVGPNNIWGLVLNGEGEAFIQEANDYGYPVMPFHEYALYPGGADRLAKSYQPPFPHTADFRMGGTGLSGLALTDKVGPYPEPWRDVMLVANPITNRINAIKMHRDGPRWRLEQLPDFLVSTDPWFRPVAITTGPDGCLYIVDWYNKIISHNEVPRAHPDRDKTRGRIWRVKAQAAKPFDVPDFTRLSGDELIAKLGGESLAQSHLAWQAIADRMSDTYEGPDATHQRLSFKEKVLNVMKDESQSAARRIGAMFALTSNPDITWIDGFVNALHTMIREPDRNIRREALRTCPGLSPKTGQEGDAEVRATIIKNIGSDWSDEWPKREASIAEQSQFVSRAEAEAEWTTILDRWLIRLLSFAGAPLAEPTAPSSRGGKPIKVREAYEREFERYLVRMFLERQPDAVAKFLDSSDSKDLPVEARLLASLALEPKASAARVAKLLPQLDRAPGQEEVLRLAEYPSEPGVGEALRAVLANPKTSAAALESLLAVKTRLDAGKLAPFLSDAANALLASKDQAVLDLGLRLASDFKLASTEPALVTLVQNGSQTIGALRALSELGSSQTDLFVRLAESSTDAAVREEALAALATSNAANAAERVLALYPKLSPAQRRLALDKLSAKKAGAGAIVAALATGTIATTDLDAATLDRLQAVLGVNDPVLAKLVDSLGALFRPVLALDGSEAAWTQTGVTLDGPCTIEAWVRLDPQGRKIGNNDSIAGAPGQLDVNFFGEKARVYAFPPHGDLVVAKKPVTPGLWTHVAATRDAAGIWKLYLDGELDTTGTRPAPSKIENVRLAWNGAKGGTQGALGEVRLWNRERTVEEIRVASDRSLSVHTPGLVFTSAAGGWGQLQAGARVVKSSDFPPILTGDEAATLDAKYAKFRALAEKPGDVEKGKVAAALCQACHLFGATGGNIGPNLSGVGAMGTEAILRNILQPNAAMENGYRIYRVELKNGDLIDALFVSEDKDAVIIRLPGSDDRRIARKDIRETKYLRRSLMPEALLDTFTPEQVTDLFAYLKTLR